MNLRRKSASMLCVITLTAFTALQSARANTLKRVEVFSPIVLKSISKRRPEESRFYNTEPSIRVPKKYLNQSMVFGLLCGESKSCTSHFTLDRAPIHASLQLNKSNLVLVDSVGNELMAWERAGEDGSDYKILPSLKVQSAKTVGGLDAALLQNAMIDSSGTSANSLWFRLKLASGDAYTAYLFKSSPAYRFKAKLPIPQIGFLVAGDFDAALIYTPQVNSNPALFNPDHLPICRWQNDQTLDWIVDPAVSELAFSAIREAFDAWAKVIPKSLQLNVRRALPNEFLQSPLVNRVIFHEVEKGSGGQENDVFDPDSGELLHAAVEIYGSSKDPERIREVAIHEIGHSFGLRHNFKGSRYLVPGGSSVMDYLANLDAAASKSVGGYDQQAINWAYLDQPPKIAYPFCSDEFLTSPNPSSLSAISADPECQRFDSVTGDAFGHAFQKLNELFVDRIPNGESATQDGFSANELSEVMSFFNDQFELQEPARFESLVQVISAFTITQPSADQTSVRKAQWIAAVRLTETLAELFKRHLYTHVARITSRHEFKQIEYWLAQTEAGPALSVRTDTIQRVIDMTARDNPAIRAEITDMLENPIRNNPGSSLASENQKLLMSLKASANLAQSERRLMK